MMHFYELSHLLQWGMHKARAEGMQMNTHGKEVKFANIYHSDKKASLTGAGRHHPEKLCSFSPLVYSGGTAKTLGGVSLLVSLDWRVLAINHWSQAPWHKALLIPRNYKSVYLKILWKYSCVCFVLIFLSCLCWTVRFWMQNYWISLSTYS